jgi:hypothetical protein
METFDRCCGDANIDLPGHERVWNAVVMAVDFDVIVRRNSWMFPQSELVSVSGQWSQGRQIERLILRAPCAGQFFKRTGVEIIHQVFDRSIQIDD